jgi:hypothetical protein
MVDLKRISEAPGCAGLVISCTNYAILFGIVTICASESVN